MNIQKIALVTGANRGIGFAVAKGLLQQGLTVLVAARDAQKGQIATQTLKAFGQAVFLHLDVADPTSIAAAKEEVAAKFGQLDVLINNAAINYDTHQQVDNADLVEVQTTLNVNLLGAWGMIQTFLPLLKKAPAARIVNVSSGSGSLASQNGSTPAYSISKLALNGLTMAFAAQLQPQGIAVNSVCPGWVRTDMGGAGAPRSPEEGADTIIWAALLENAKETGKFFRDRKVQEW